MTGEERNLKNSISPLGSVLKKKIYLLRGEELR